MEDYVRKMCIEHKALSAKIMKLEKKLETMKEQKVLVSYESYGLMVLQLNAMNSYLNTLEKRINLKGVEVSVDGDYYEKADI